MERSPNQGEDTMTTRILPLVGALAAGVALGAAGLSTLHAQGAIKRTLLQRIDMRTDVPREVVLGVAEIPAGMRAGKHTHPGEEMGYVIEGGLELAIDGKPPLTLKAGDSYQIPLGAPHDAKATGTTPARVIGVYLVEKGKPLATPAP
jgi:quercetin dioxygenase-like cupin family protein